MDDSLKMGFMAVFAVSGSVVVLAMHAHNRLLSDFLKKLECEIKTSTGVGKDEEEAKVRLADDVAESTLKKAYRKNKPPRPAAAASRNNDKNLDAMPENWQILYKGILQNRRGI